jgi:hypothetical protein
MGKPTPKKVFAFTPAGTMGMPDRKVKMGKFDTPGMTMNMDMNSGGMDHPKMKMPDTTSPTDQSKTADARAMPGMDMGQSAIKQEGGMDQGTMRMGPKMGGPLGRPMFKNGREMVVDGMDPKRPLPPYPKLKAIHSTAPDPSLPVREIRLTLDGDMERYVWLLNNKALHESDQIHIKEGEVVRFIMINRTMMYHPMHLHGHFFRVINGQGDRSPLKHTVTVMPMATTVFEFEANEVGDWFFHCHLLYHMHAGMARVVEYDEFTPAPETAAVRDRLFEVDPYFYGAGDFMSHMTEGYAELTGIRYSAMVGWEIGWANVAETEYEIDITANYFHNRFLSLFVGAELTNNELYPDARGIFGYRYPLPFLLSTFGWADTGGEFRFGVAKSYPITDRLHVFGEIEYDTRTDYEWAAGLEYILTKELSITGNYHSEFGAGGGVAVRF